MEKFIPLKFNELIKSTVIFIWLSAFILLSYTNPGNPTIQIAFGLLALLCFCFILTLLANPKKGLKNHEVPIFIFIIVWILASILTLLVTNKPIDHAKNMSFFIAAFVAGAFFARYFFCTSVKIRDKIILHVTILFIVVNIAANLSSANGAEPFSGVFRDRNFFSFYSAIILWITHFMQSPSLITLAIRIILIALILFTGSISGLLLLTLYFASLLVGAWIRLPYKKRGALILMILVGSISASLIAPYIPAVERTSKWVTFCKSGFEGVPDRSSVSRRANQILEGIKIIHEHPILGVGYGSVRDHVETRYGGPGFTLHNTFIEIWASAGITSFTVFITFVLIIPIITFYRSKSKSIWPILGSLMIIVFLSTYTTYQRIGPIFFMALIYWLCLRETACPGFSLQIAGKNFTQKLKDYPE